MKKANGFTQHDSSSSFASFTTCQRKLIKLPKLLRCSLLACFLALAVTATASVPVPYIDLIKPIGAVPGGASFTLNVRGAGFVPNALVYWRLGVINTPLKTTYVNPTYLKAFVPADLISSAETATITVVNPAPIPASNPVFFPIHAPFSALPGTPVDITVGTPSALFNRPIAVADFNGDGVLDLAVGSAGADTVSIFFGSGTGTFTVGPVLPVGSTPTMVAVGDFNNDGYPDIATTSWDDGHVYIYTGGPGGTFTLQPIITVTCCLAWVQVADFNGDGKLDLAMAVINGSTGWVQVLWGNGDGTFVSPGLIVPIPGAGAQPTAVAIADFNGDNRLDLAVTDVILSEVHILLGSGSGSTFNFTYGAVLSTLDNPAPVALGDFNQDGILDIAVSNLYTNNVSIFQGGAGATFTSVDTFPAGDGPFAIAAANFDGNQKIDLVVADHFGNTSRIWRNNSSSSTISFIAGPSVVLDPGDGPTFVAVGDFNNDGALDYITGSEYEPTISVVLQVP